MKILSSPAWLRCTLFFLIGASLVPSAGAQRGPGVRIIDGAAIENPVFEARQTVTPLSPIERKIGQSIRRKVKQLEEAGITSPAAKGVASPESFSTKLLHVDAEGRIHAYVHLDSLESEKVTVLEAIPDLVVDASNANMAVVQAWIPAGQVEAVAELSFVEKVSAPSYGFTQAGSVQSEGDAIHNADDVRLLGLSGLGVKIGIISDGYNGLATAVGTGDLPAGVLTYGTSLGGEGVSMAEIIHDLAPGATLAICQGFNTTLEFINCVDTLKDTFGADVIVDDVTFFGEPMFEDGQVAAAYQGAINMGVAVVTAGGNWSEGHYQGVFNNDGTGRHLFAPGDRTIAMRLDRPGNCQGFQQALQTQVIAFLQWSEPFGQAGDDFAICYLDSANPGSASFEICSDVTQDGDDNPFEFVFFEWQIDAFDCFSSLFLEVGRFNLTDNDTLEIFVLPVDLNGAILSFTDQGDDIVKADSIFGHPAVPGVIGTAAINAGEPGNDAIAPYSSQGPSTTCLYNGNACSTAPGREQRATPAITGIDGVSVTTAGLGFSPFFGTSAAAPHIAAIAALMLEASPSLTPAQILAALQSTADDRGAAGFDNIFGAGLANALSAVNALDFDLTVTALAAPTVGEVGGVITTSTTVENLGLGAAGAFDVAYYFSSDGVLDGGDTRSTTVCSVPGLAGGASDSSTCASHPVSVPASLAAASYTLFAVVDDLNAVVETNESNNDLAADTGAITLSVSACPSDLLLDNQTLSGTQTLQATTTATLGPNLIIDGTSITVNAPIVTILSNTDISGTFSVGVTPACP